MTMNVKCPECEEIVPLPGGLALSGIENNPNWKGVQCPYCFESIPAQKVKEVFSNR